MIQIRLFRETSAAPEGGGGGANSPALSFLMGRGVSEGLEPDGVTLQPGYERNAITGMVSKIAGYQPPNPGQTPPTPAKPASTANTPEPVYVDQTEALNANGTLKPGYIREQGTDKIMKDPAYKAPEPVIIEGVNPDGTIKEGYVRNQDGTVTKAGTPGTGNEGDDDDTAFIQAVENITGQKYQITYPDGVTPTSPEGIAIRENHIREVAAQTFERHIQSTMPRAYAFMLHLAAGGTEEDFMKGPAVFSLPDLTAMKASADLQASVYKQDLIDKGLTAEKAQALVDIATKNNTLGTEAEAAWNARTAAQNAQIKSLEQKNREAEDKYNNSVSTLVSNLDNAIKTEISFLVPEARQGEFRKFIMSNLQYDDGKFFVVQPLATENFKTAIEALFFQFQNGDLNKLIAKKAKTEAAQTLKLKLNKSNNSSQGSSDGGNSSTKNLPLSAILPNAQN